MSATLQTPVGCSSIRVEAPRWGLASRVAFRFCFLYFGLYCLLTQILGSLIPIPGLEIRNAGTLPAPRAMVLWTAQHLFRYGRRVIYSGSGSGDKVFDSVQVSCLLVLALVGTCIWSAVDRRRAQYDNLYKWFRVFIRFALAGQLFVYGSVKVFPEQMPFPYLTKLLEKFGDFSPMGVLWFSVGASPAYERFVGCAELFAGLLLVIPATTMLGALICLVDMIEVFALNMTYDVPVKLLSFHLILLAAFLLIPERRRLIQFCLRGCAVERAAARRLFAGRHAHRIALTVQIVFGLLLLGIALNSARQNWFKYGGGAPKSVLYGIWNVDEMSIDGVVRAPLLTDYGRWRRIIFDFPQSMTFQRMDDSFGAFAAVYDPKRSMLALNRRGDRKWNGQLAVQRPSAGRMILDGQLGQHKTRMQLSLVDRDKFLLVSRGFHWIQDYPFNR